MTEGRKGKRKSDRNTWTDGEKETERETKCGRERETERDIQLTPTDVLP